MNHLCVLPSWHTLLWAGAGVVLGIALLYLKGYIDTTFADCIQARIEERGDIFEAFPVTQARIYCVIDSYEGDDSLALGLRLILFGQ